LEEHQLVMYMSLFATNITLLVHTLAFTMKQGQPPTCRAIEASMTLHMAAKKRVPGLPEG
jgi:hypothetical protein